MVRHRCVCVVGILFPNHMVLGSLLFYDTTGRSKLVSEFGRWKATVLFGDDTSASYISLYWLYYRIRVVGANPIVARSEIYNSYATVRILITISYIQSEIDSHNFVAIILHTS